MIVCHRRNISEGAGACGQVSDDMSHAIIQQSFIHESKMWLKDLSIKDEVMVRDHHVYGNKIKTITSPGNYSCCGLVQPYLARCS